MSLSIELLNDAFPPQIDGVATAVANYGRYLTAHGHRAAAAVPFVPDADDGVWPFPVIRYPSLDTSKLIGYRAGMPFDAAEAPGREAGPAALPLPFHQPDAGADAPGRPARASHHDLSHQI